MARGFRLTLDQAAIRRLSERGGDIDSAVARAASRSRERARRNVDRLDTGRLRQAISSERKGDSRHRVGTFGTGIGYALYQEEGTRAHGPRTAKFLRFKPKGARMFVFAKRVRGVRPSRFLRRALQALRPNDFT